MFSEVFDALNRIFLQFAPRESVFSIDEIISLSKTCLNPLMQFIPNKKDKRGHGFRMLNGSFSRYCVKFSLIWPSYCRPIQLRKVKGIIDFFTLEIQGTWSKLVFDNFYNSHDVCLELLQKGLYCLGTVKYHYMRSMIAIPKTLPSRNFVRNQKVLTFGADGEFLTVFGIQSEYLAPDCI